MVTLEPLGLLRLITITSLQQRVLWTPVDALPRTPCS